MDQDAFVKRYFGLLSQYFAAEGFDPKAVFAAVLDGTRAMIRNDGSRTNEDLFWDVFCKSASLKKDDVYLRFNAFYDTQFDFSRDATGENPEARDAVAAAHSAADLVVLSTNPLFPPAARPRAAFVDRPCTFRFRLYHDVRQLLFLQAEPALFFAAFVALRSCAAGRASRRQRRAGGRLRRQGRRDPNVSCHRLPFDTRSSIRRIFARQLFRHGTDAEKVFDSRQAKKRREPFNQTNRRAASSVSPVRFL